MNKLQTEKIHELAKRDHLAFKKHTVLRMYQRSIFADEVTEAMEDCKIIEDYPSDYPLPSFWVLGYTKGERAIHVVTTIDEEEGMLWIITLYEPSLLEWEEGFEKRRKKDEMSTV